MSSSSILHHSNNEHSDSFVYNDILIKSANPLVTTKLGAIVEAPKFKKWLDDFNKDEINFKEFYITDCDFFGPVAPNRLGFVKGYGKAFDQITGDAIPAIAFLRGDAVAVLIVVKVIETGKKHVLVCRQLRFPCGRSMVEVCAGMIDHNTKNVIGVVFNEVHQETGFTITEESLLSLGSIRPSAGGCDEVIHLYAWETEITQAEYNKKLANVYGEGSYERIKLLFYDYDTFDNTLDEIGDAKAECCWRRYQRIVNKRDIRISATSSSSNQSDGK